MIKSEHTQTYGWEGAVRGMKAKGYRMNKVGNFEVFASKHGESSNLGTYKNEEEAKEAYQSFRIQRFVDGVKSAGLNPDDGVVIYNHYVAFKNGEIFNLYGKKLIGHIDKCGYREVLIDLAQKRVHRLIAEAFIPNPEGKKCVNHKDGNKLNNDVSNLEWVSHSENTIHAFKTGLEVPPHGEEMHNHKLTEENVMFAMKNYIPRDKEYGITALAKKFGVNRTTLSGALRGKTWRYLNDQA